MQVTLLSADQREAINTRSLRMLAETGVRVPHAETLSRFADAGARVDLKTERVRLPPELVLRLVAGAGKRYTLYGRDRARTAAFGQGRRNYNAIAGEASWVDAPGSDRRFPTLSDVATAARFGDALEALTIPGAMADPEGVPVACRCVEVMAQMGLSAPATIAGAMALENAEVLAGICITQLIQPGLPVCYGGICHAFDMRTTQMIFAGPEQALFGVGMTELGKALGLPVYINVGLTDSKRPDAQAGLEIMGTLLPGAAAGADIFGHMGICGVDQATSLDTLLLQHEAIRYVESTLREIATDDDAIPLDLIDEVGPGGTYLDTPHTAAHFRESLFMPQLLDRDYFPTWYAKGATSMADRIAARKAHILETHTPEPIAPDLDRELTRIVQAAQRHLAP